MDTKIRRVGLLVILPLVLTAFSFGFMVEVDTATAQGSPLVNSPQNLTDLPMMTLYVATNSALN
ncbi:MAG: hypothetical protein OEQ12_02125 [Nitrosopumilus sp.]|nr:hypothetical protein [Nitrosopumilus sp.]